MNSIAKAGFKETQQRDAHGRWSSSGGGTLARVSRRTGASESVLRSFASNSASAVYNAAKAAITISSLVGVVREGSLREALPDIPDATATAVEHLRELKRDLRGLRSDVRALRKQTRGSRARAYAQMKRKLQQVDAKLKSSLRMLARRRAREAAANG